MLIWRTTKDNLVPEFVLEIERLFIDCPYDFYVLSGYRSNEEQAELYRKFLNGGPRAAPPGKSAHNKGLAIDVALDIDGSKAGLQPGWDIRHPGWAWLAKVLPPSHPTLKHGRSFHDWPHIEAKNWRNF